MAAITDLNWPLEEVRNINVHGTKSVLDFAVLCKKDGSLKKVNHISTVYVVGAKRCKFKESDLDVSQKFNNTYEQTKYISNSGDGSIYFLFRIRCHSLCGNQW